MLSQKPIRSTRELQAHKQVIFIQANFIGLGQLVLLVVWLYVVLQVPACQGSLLL